MRISDWSSDVCSSDLHLRRTDGELMRRLPNYLLINLALAALVALLFVASVYVGRGRSLLFTKLHALDQIDRSLAWWLLTEIRLPRAFLGLVVGAQLGVRPEARPVGKQCVRTSHKRWA